MYLRAERKRTDQREEEDMNKESLLKELADSVAACDPVRSKKAAEQALKEGLDPVVAINEGLVIGMGVIGDNYAIRKMYLPQVLVAAHSMYEGLEVLLPAIPKGDLKGSKTAITAVVMGDVHDIGKNIVGIVLQANGFRVVDLGSDVDPVAYMDAARKEKADAVGISALMTTTMPGQEEFIKLVAETGDKGKYVVCVGGAPTSVEWAERIGADLWSFDAFEFAAKLKDMLG